MVIKIFYSNDCFRDFTESCLVNIYVSPQYQDNLPLPLTHPTLPPPSSYTTKVLTLRIMFILDIILHPHDQTTIKIMKSRLGHGMGDSRLEQRSREISRTFTFHPPSSHPLRSD